MFSSSWVEQISIFFSSWFCSTLGGSWCFFFLVITLWTFIVDVYRNLFPLPSVEGTLNIHHIIVTKKHEMGCFLSLFGCICCNRSVWYSNIYCWIDSPRVVGFNPFYCEKICFATNSCLKTELQQWNIG